MFCRGFGFGGFGGYGGYGNFGGGLFFLGMGIRLIIMAAIIILIVRLFKRHVHGSGNALKILNERYAKGEITEEEYVQRKTILTKKN